MSLYVYVSFKVIYRICNKYFARDLLSSQVSGYNPVVWIVGSSIIAHAQDATSSYLGKNLQLPATIHWYGHSGAPISYVETKVTELLRKYGHPDMVIVHAGGNNFGTSSCLTLRKMFRYCIIHLNQLLPDTLVVWSQILPRTYWRYMFSGEAAEKVRLRLNNFAGSLAIRQGGAYIKYPDLNVVTSDLFADDGVHLKSLGNEIFLTTLQGAIYTFITSLQQIYPLL